MHHRHGPPSDDPIEQIELALVSLRRGGRRSWAGPHGGHAHDHGSRHGAPAGAGGPWSPSHDADAPAPPWSGRRGGRGGWDVGPVARFRVLATLDHADHPLSVTELARAVGVDQPRASRLVQALVDEGMARREADPGDARRTRVRLTDEGRGTLRNAASHRRGVIAAALEGFTDEERTQFAALLTRFAAGLHGDPR